MRPDPIRPLFPLAALVAGLALAGCGADPVAPANDHVVYFPSEASTLQAAIDMAQTNEIVTVEDGQHTVDAPVVIPTSKAGLVLRGADGTRPTLVFTVSPDSADAIVVLAPNVSVRNLEILGTFRVGILYQPGGTDGTGDVSDCIVRGAGLYAVECGSAAADITVQRNILVDAGKFGVICTQGCSPVIQNNTIVGAADCGIYVDFSFPECRRNIIAQSATWGIACFTSQTLALGCNVLYANGNADYSPDCVPGTDDQHADPMFCDTTSFTLLPGSPCAPANAGACQGIGAVTTVCAP